MPSFDRTVVTASGDRANAFGASDIALGSFGLKETLLKGSGTIIRVTGGTSGSSIHNSGVRMLVRAVIGRPRLVSSCIS